MADRNPAPGTGEDQGTADTQGWDTVAAITYTEVNKAIAQSGSYPKKFSQEADDKSAAASGDFTGWKITTGGAGPRIQMELTIANGKFAPEGETARSFEGSAVIELESEFVPQPGKSALDLKLSKTAPVSVPSANLKGLSKFYAGAAKDLIATWLTDNIGEFNHIFATVNLDRELVKDGIPWLAPSFQGYAVAEPMTGPTLDNSVLGVMCLIDDGKPGTGLAEQISPFAIPAGHKAGFLISHRKFLSHIMRPGLAMLFKGLDGKNLDDYFDVTGNGTLIQNKTQLTMRDYKLHDMTVAPIVDAAKFQLQCGATELSLSIYDMWFDVPLFGFIHEAMTAKLTYNGRYKMRLDDKGHSLALDIIQESSSAGVVSSQGWQITQYVLGGLSVLACITGAGFVIGARVVGAAAAGASVAAGEAAVLGGSETGELTAAAAEEAFAGAAEAMSTGATQGVNQIGINLATAARCAFAAAGALGLAPSIGMIQKAVADGQIQQTPPLQNLIDQGLAKIVQFPATLGQLNLTTARCNQSLQLGMK
jgi:Clostridium P-47 protein